MLILGPCKVYCLPTPHAGFCASVHDESWSDPELFCNTVNDEVTAECIFRAETYNTVSCMQWTTEIGSTSKPACISGVPPLFGKKLCDDWLSLVDWVFRAIEKAVSQDLVEQDITWHTCPKPQGACVDTSPCLSNRSANNSLHVNQPRREPGAIV